MSLNGGWCAVKEWARTWRNVLGLISMIVVGALAIDGRYLTADDTKDFVKEDAFSERLESIDNNIGRLSDQIETLSISTYESSLIQTELAIGNLEARENLNHQDQRQLEDLRIKRRNLIDNLRRLRSSQP